MIRKSGSPGSARVTRAIVIRLGMLFALSASRYSVGLIWPRPWPAIWSAIATSPANCGAEQDVPPTMNQPPAPGAVS